MDGTPEEVFSKQKELLAMGLDVPQSTAFANKLKEAGIKLEGGTVTPELCAETVIKALKAMDRRG
jgi:energy-coupling factor transport system ATP-binding protein